MTPNTTEEQQLRVWPYYSTSEVSSASKQRHIFSSFFCSRQGRTKGWAIEAAAQDAKL